MIRYHYILLTLIILLAMGACTKYDQVDITPARDRVSFGAEVTEVKGVETTSLNVDGSEFNVAAYISDGDAIPQFSYYFDATVGYNKDKWSYDNPQYWTANSIDFHAYSPIVTLGEGSLVEENVQGLSDAHALVYECPYQVDKQIDLLVATHVSEKEDLTTLSFDHALSMITFKINFSEDNINFKKINIDYTGLVSKGSYNFDSESWTLGSETYSDTQTTSIEVNEVLTSSATYDCPSSLIILPQDIATDGSGACLNLELEYALISGSDKSEVGVTTPVVKVDVSTGSYLKGTEYIYTINVKGEDVVLSLDAVEIVPQEDLVVANGNIDLNLVATQGSSSYMDLFGRAISEPEVYSDGNFYYYTTAQRVSELLTDGVRDFVVYGSLGAAGESVLGNGVLGYWGGVGSSPFILGVTHSGLNNALFSVDLRQVYDFPTFDNAHVDASSSDVETSLHQDNVLDGDSPILAAGLFAEVQNLNEIMLPEELTAIGDYALSNCDNLVTIDLGGVQHLEMGAVSANAKLRFLENGHLTRIHSHAVQSCSVLESVSLGQVVEIDEYGFQGCSSLGVVDLSKLNYIEKFAFADCSKLDIEGTSPVIYDSVPVYAFYNCNELSAGGVAIDLTQVNSVNMHAFQHAANLLLTNGECSNLTEVGDCAFSGCSSITQFNIPNVQVVGNSAFYGCSSLNPNPEGTFSFNDLITVDVSGFQGCSSLGTIAMPNVESIGEYAFNGCSVMDLSQGVSMDKLITVGDHAFNKCYELSEISMPAVETIGAFGFYSCSALDFAGGVFAPAKLRSIGAFAFDNCSSLSSEIQLGAITTDVGSYAFSGTAITSLVMEGVSVLNPEVFSYCYNIKNLSLPLVSDINCPVYQDSEGNDVQRTVFSMLDYSCSVIETLNLPLLEGSLDNELFKNDYVSLKTVNLASIETVGNSAFSSCSALESIDLSLATSLGTNAFTACSALNQVTIPKVLTINDAAFSYCTSLESIDLSSATYVGNNVFDGCSLLKSVTLGNELLVLGSSVFSNTSLESINLNNVTSVGASAFSGCSILNSFTAEHLQTVANQTFTGCTELGSLSLPELESCAWASFSDCENLSSLILPKLTSCGWDFVDGCTSLEVLNMNSLSLTMSEICGYVDDDVESNIKELYLDGATSTSSMSNWTSLEHISIKGVTEITAGAFQGLSTLKTVDLGTVTVVGQQAFQDCTSLVSLDLSSVVSVGNWVFSGLSSLEYLDLNSWAADSYTDTEGGVTYDISWGYFGSLTSLKHLNLASAKILSPSAFSGVSTLEQLDLSGLETVMDGANADVDYLDPFCGITNTENCYVRLGSAQDAVADKTNNTWAGKTWKGILSVGEEFPAE